MSETERKPRPNTAAKTKPRKASRADAKASGKTDANMRTTRGAKPARRKTGDDTGEAESKRRERREAEKGRSFPIWIFILLGTAIVLAFAIWSYYPVAKQQYIESRQKERLQAELAIIEERNQQLQDEIDRLGTDEGIEDYARNELGWVKKGEKSVIVEGLDGGAKSSTGVDWRVDAEDIKLTNTRWTRFLDMIFGIESE